MRTVCVAQGGAHVFGLTEPMCDSKASVLLHRMLLQDGEGDFILYAVFTVNSF